ncbi:MAG: mechanosensitive ion channel [Neisseria zoodegmatis]|uniref:mechanosensitive ion channel family protein n=1 Tax=Neisseria zoodegmatis TaxID=326523 RepID=UPI0026EA7103|nr:mechanosensitive ion channel domain-containing protein [Neisseria zoodegmatis]MDO5068586.1 mechanosensitive ion channel [Neisseria zoodegmatis]
MSDLYSAGSRLLESTGFAGLFTRQQFAAQLLERSFNSPEGWLELGTAAVIMAVTFLLSVFWIKKHPLQESGRWVFARHIAQRVLWPVMMLVAAVAATYLWDLRDNNALWLPLLAMAARWMILIRVSLAIVHAALPASKFTDWLERFLSGLLWFAFLLWVSGVDDIIINSMKALELPIGSVRLNLFTVLTGLLWIVVLMVLALWLARFIDSRLMSNSHLDLNLRIVLSKVVKTVMLALSVLIALPLVGIDLTVLSVFGGALGVGIGFGLQKVASNYISGFIILGDRSIRPGDRLTVNDFTGYVTKITSRFVVLSNASGSEALIPNETFVTSTVINESYTNASLRQSLNIQVAYNTDLTKALSILEEVAAEQDRVDASPPPKAVITGFGENGIDLSIGFWVKDPENGFVVLFSNIFYSVWKRFNAEGIEFPFPQREVRILNEGLAPENLGVAASVEKNPNESESTAEHHA